MSRRQGFQRLLLLLGFFSLLTGETGRLQAQPAIAQSAADGPRAVIAAKLFVDDDNAGKQDGSALHPFKTLQQAIDAAANNDVIAVAAGTYSQNIKVQDKAVRLYGGYVGGTAASYAAGTEGNFKERSGGQHFAP
jgi:pectin methylesterase-like acyl-CoA thioesterase